MFASIGILLVLPNFLNIQNSILFSNKNLNPKVRPFYQLSF